MSYYIAYGMNDIKLFIRFYYDKYEFDFIECSLYKDFIDKNKLNFNYVIDNKLFNIVTESNGETYFIDSHYNYKLKFDGKNILKEGTINGNQCGIIKIN